MAVKIDQIKIEIARSTEDACKAIAKAAELATETLASAAVNAKNVIATDAARVIKVEDKKKTDNEKLNNFSGFIYKQLSFGLSIIGIVIGAFIYLTNPAKDNDTALQLQDQRISQQQKTIDGLNLTAQNDTKELKNEVAGLRTEIQTATIKITELSTIINERMPAKK
jgi:hypothetical protein